MPNRSDSKMKHLVCKTDGTYYVETADVKDRYALGRSTKQLRLVPRQAVFYETPPVRFNTLEELISAPNPTPVLGGGTRWGIYGDENPAPVTIDNEFQDPELILEELRTLDVTTHLQRSEETMAKSGRAEQNAEIMKWIGIGSVMLASCFVLVVTVLFLIPRLN